jgi:high-affinity nickel-transport protein
MIAAFSYMALGFLLGMRHATDADHVIAVSTIVTRQRSVRGGVLIGAVWGLGHTLTIIVVGGAIIVFRVVIPPVLGLTMEMTVALMLVGLGVWNLREVRAPNDHGHREDQTPQAWLDRRLGTLATYQLGRPLVVGLVHGLAGSAAVALLVLATINDARWAMAYLLLFGVGTIVGMMLITATLAAPLAYASRRSTRVGHHLRVASGLLSVGIGLFLVYQIGFVDGLFTGDPTWTPH